MLSLAPRSKLENIQILYHLKWLFIVITFKGFICVKRRDPKQKYDNQKSKENI